VNLVVAGKGDHDLIAVLQRLQANTTFATSWKAKMFALHDTHIALRTVHGVPLFTDPAKAAIIAMKILLVGSAIKQNTTGAERIAKLEVASGTCALNRLFCVTILAPNNCYMAERM